MRAFDFDNTIYDGESTVDFFMFCMKKHPSLITYFPRVVYSLLKYKLCIMSREAITKYVEKVAFDALDKIGDVDCYVKMFWDKNEKKIKKFYLDDHEKTDIVISAGPSFLLDEALRRIGITNRICSEVCFKTRKITKLCFRSNKRELFEEAYPGDIIDEFYTDSANDKSLMAICRKVYKVKNDEITLYKVNKI